MTIKECIDKVDNLYPNQYSEEQKVDWLSRLDYDIYHNLILQHEYNEGEEEVKYEPYSVNDMAHSLIAPFPYDELYIAYLRVKIDEANEETANYNNSVALFSSYYQNYAGMYVRKHTPINTERYHTWRR